MRRHRSDTSDVEDFYGPGTDLVLCILVAAVLLLVLVGVTLRRAPQATETRDGAEAEQGYVPLTPSQGRSPFQQNGYDLSELGLSELVGGLRAKRAQFTRSGANTLLIEGFASAEPDQQTVQRCGAVDAHRGCISRDVTDRNLDLAYSRARRVWEHLVFVERIPRWCTAIVVHGRNRSETLQQESARIAGKSGRYLPSEAEIGEWDRHWIEPDDSIPGEPVIRLPMAPDDPRLEAERKVEIRAIHDPRALCGVQDLKVALGKL